MFFKPFLLQYAPYLSLAAALLAGNQLALPFGLVAEDQRPAIKVFDLKKVNMVDHCPRVREQK